MTTWGVVVADDEAQAFDREVVGFRADIDQLRAAVVETAQLAARLADRDTQPRDSTQQVS